MKTKRRRWKKLIAGLAVAAMIGTACSTVGVTPAKAEESVTPQDASVTVAIKEDKVTALENGKTYIIMSYPNGGQALSAVVKPLSESSGTYNYLKPIPVTISGTTATFNSADDAADCKFTAEENPLAKGEFRLNNNGMWLYKYYSMMETTSDADAASWFTYSSSKGLQHTDSDLVSSYPYIACRNNVYMGWTNVTSPINIYEVAEAAASYTVNFDSNGGSSVSPVTVEAGGTIEKPEDPVRDNYVFDGWYTDTTYAAAWNFSDPVNETMTLVAKWRSASGEEPVVYVQRVMTMQAGKTYLITGRDDSIAMSAARGNTYYDNTRGGKPVTLGSSEGKTYVTFADVDEKHACLWESGAYEGAGDGQVTLAQNGALLDTYMSSAHCPAEMTEDETYKNNILFYADSSGIHAADTGSTLCYRTSPDTMVGFAPNSGSAAKLYEVVPEDYVHTHTLVEVPEVAATCTKAGTAGYFRCSVCGALTSDAAGEHVIDKPETIPAKGHAYGAWESISDTQHSRVCANDAGHIETADHSWDAGVITKQPTETEEGEITFTCTGCGKTRTAPLAPATGTCPVDESAGYLVAVTPAKELTAGKQYVVVSKEKDKVMTAENIRTEYGGYRLAAADVTVEETDGRVLFASAADADAAIWDCTGTSDMATLSHGDGNLNNYMAYLWCGDSSMYNTGSSVFTYTHGETMGYGRLTSGGFSNYHVGYDEDYDAFVTNTDRYCVVYEVTGTIGQIAGTSHNLVKTAAKEPTCTGEGNIEYYTCSKCHQVFRTASGSEADRIAIEDTVIPAAGHKTELTAETEAKCEEAGNDAYYTCSVCGKYFSDADAVHEIAKDSWVREPVGHDWDSGEVTKEALCETGGEITYTCKHDPSHTKTEVIEPGGHNWQMTESLEATCTEDGYELWRCVKCGTEEKRNVKKASGHKAGEAIKEHIHAATCENTSGYDLVTYCTVCGEEISREENVTPATGHSYGTPSYTWSADGKTVTAKAVCQADPSHILTETAAAVSKVTAKATLKKAGTIKRTAAFDNAVFKTQVKTAAIPKVTLGTPKITVKQQSVKKVQVSWKKVAGATGYKVAYRKAGASKWKVKTVTGTKTTLSGRKASTLWEYKVAAVKKATAQTAAVTGKYSAVSRCYAKKGLSLKVTAGKKAAGVSWKKVAGASGYQVKYSAYKSMKNAKTVTVKGGKKTAKTIKNLKKGKKYYVTVQPYKTKSGKKYTGVPTKVKAVKVK